MRTPKRLSIARIESARALGHDLWLSDDDGSRGGGRLLIRISACGTRLWYFRGSYRRRTYIVPLGRYSRAPLEGCLTLTQARERARHCGVLMREGSLRAEVPQACAFPTASPAPYAAPASPATEPALTALPQLSETTLLGVCNEYVAHLEDRRSKSYANTTRLNVKNYIATNALASKPANQVTTKDILELLCSVNAQGSPDKTNRIRTLLLAAYNHAMRAARNAGVSGNLRRLEITFNPVKDTETLETLSEPLERNLSAAELGQFWRLLTTIPNADAVKYKAIRIAFLLGGQRCTQLLCAKRFNVNVDSKRLTLIDTKGRRKKPRVHWLPLSPLAWAELGPLLEEAKRLGKTYLFPGKGGDCHIGADVISHAVLELSAILLHAGKIEEPFSYRDLRRTAETRMGDLEIDQEVRCQIQSHGLGGVQTRHYNRSDFLALKRVALEKWQHFLFQCAKAAEPSAPQVQPRELCV